MNKYLLSLKITQKWSNTSCKFRLPTKRPVKAGTAKKSEHKQIVWDVIQNKADSLISMIKIY